MPGGSQYEGPQDALERYTAVVIQSGGELKGAKNPYTSRNGHMFSFLDKEGSMALRLPDGATAEFLAAYDSGPVMQYGKVMRGYVSVPSDLLDRPGELTRWFERSSEWIGSLPPKPTKKG